MGLAGFFARAWPTPIFVVRLCVLVCGLLGVCVCYLARIELPGAHPRLCAFCIVCLACAGFFCSGVCRGLFTCVSLWVCVGLFRLCFPLCFPL